MNEFMNELMNDNLILRQVLGLKYGYKTRNEIYLLSLLQKKNVQNGDAQSQKLQKL